MHGNQPNRLPNGNRTLYEPSSFSNLIGTEKFVAFHFLSLPPTPNHRDACFLVTFIHIDILTVFSSLQIVLSIRSVFQSFYLILWVWKWITNAQKIPPKSYCFSYLGGSGYRKSVLYHLDKCLVWLHIYHPDYPGKDNSDLAMISRVQELYYVSSGEWVQWAKQ